MDGLTTGRMVHFVPPTRGSAEFALEVGHLAAVVTKVVDGVAGLVNLTVFCVFAGPVTVGNVQHSEKGEPGTWHWIERV